MVGNAIQFPGTSLILHPEVRELVGSPKTLAVCETKICDLPNPITQQNIECPCLYVYNLTVSKPVFFVLHFRPSL